jgi:hypothetical protein
MAALSMRTAMRLAILALAFAMPCARADILGKKPGYLEAHAVSFANSQATARQIWAPGLDDDYVPQGLAVDGRSILVAAYRSGDTAVATGPCRVFRVDIATGRETGHFDAPAGCGHAAGLANLTGGVLVLADIHDLWRIDLEQAFATGSAERALRGHVKLGGALEGHFATFDGADLWIGVYTVTRDAARAKMYRLPLRVFDEQDGRTIDERQAIQTLAVPPLGQGAAFAGDELWMAASSSRVGALYRLDRITGRVITRYDILNGIEGIAFDEAGRLWTVSEAGARKYQHWPQLLPIILEIDIAKLK